MSIRTAQSPPHAEFFPPPPKVRSTTGWAVTVAADYRELMHFWPVVQNMVVQELRVRYQRSVLGFNLTKYVRGLAARRNVVLVG